MFSQVAVLLTLSASVLCNVFVTEPVASTSWAAGQQQTVTWQDSGSTPTLQSFGPAIISIYVGNALQQTQLQVISPSTDVSKASSVQFSPNPSIGPNSGEYFIRFESISLKDATNPQYPALAFSAKFTLTGMTGQFNSSVQSQIDGQSTAPIGGSSAAGASSAPAAAASTTPLVKVTSSSSPSKASGASGAVKPTGSSAAVPVSLNGFAATAAGAAAAVAFAMAF